MANINQVFLLFPPNNNNDFKLFKSEDTFKKGNNIFHYFNTNSNKKIHIKKSKSKKINKRILKNPTDFSSDKGKVRYNTDLNDDFDFIIKSKGIKIKEPVDSKKKISINNLFYKDKNIYLKKENKKDEENEININPLLTNGKSEKNGRNKLLLKDDNNTTSYTAKKHKYFVNETLSSFYKDIFNLKINLKNSKNFSLYKNKLRKNNNIKTEVKQSISEYHLKTKNSDAYKMINSTKKKTKFSYPYKTKYIFKNREILPTTKFKGLPDSVKNMNKFYMNSVKSETSKYFGNNFSILRKEHFSAKFRNPLLNNNLLNEKNNTKEEKYKKIKEDIISGQIILNEIDIFKRKHGKKSKLTTINNIYYKFKKWFIRFSEFCKILLIKPYQYLEIYYKVFNNKDIAFFETQHMKTSELISSIKSNNINAANRIMEEYPPSVMNKDYFEYTPLHWAVRKKFIEIIPNIILYGADINAGNFLGETSLHLSVKNNDYDSTVLLLIFMANPFKRNYKGKRPFDYINDYQMNLIYKKIERLYFVNEFKRNKYYINDIQNKFIDFILDELSNQLSKVTLDLIGQISKRINKGKKEEKK